MKLVSCESRINNVCKFQNEYSSCFKTGLTADRFEDRYKENYNWIILKKKNVADTFRDNLIFDYYWFFKNISLPKKINPLI